MHCHLYAPFTYCSCICVHHILLNATFVYYVFCAPYACYACPCTIYCFCTRVHHIVYAILCTIYCLCHCGHHIVLMPFCAQYIVYSRCTILSTLSIRLLPSPIKSPYLDNCTIIIKRSSFVLKCSWPNFSSTTNKMITQSVIVWHLYIFTVVSFDRNMCFVCTLYR